MIQVCYYKGCGIVYGEKEPLSDKGKTHGLCPKHFEASLKEIKAEMEKLKDVTGGLKILVVEDSSLFQELFRLTLQNRFPSFGIYGAVNSKEALKKVEELRPNLIFMDIRLPGESGLELTRRIKASHPDMIIIILTSYDLPQYREAAIRYKADYFLPKDSLTAKDIFSLVESILPDRL